MLLYGIIQTMEEQYNRTNCQAAFPIYFFCQGTDDRFNTAQSVMQSLLAFLFDKFPNLRQAHLNPMDTYCAEWVLLIQKIKDVLRDLCHQGVYLIVDALDECVDGLQKLLKVIVELSESTSNKTKVLVSSRNWPSIESELDSSSQTLKLSLEEHQPSVSSAVNAYIADQVSDLTRKKKYSPDLRRTIHEFLESNAGGTFLWVALVCKKIADMDTSVDDVYDTLEKNFPPTLEKFYGRMVDNIRNSSRFPDLCEQILAIACVVYRPLSWAEMKSLLKSPTKNDATTAIRSCGSFLTTDEDGAMITFVHLSAKDFLITNEYASRRVLPGGLPHQHYLVFDKSLDNLTKTLQCDIYGLEHTGSLKTHVLPPDHDPLAPIRYSCVYWINHLLELDKPRQQARSYEECDDFLVSVDSNSRDPKNTSKVGGAICHFLEKKYLQWLEALSLISEIRWGVQAMGRLESHLVRPIKILGFSAILTKT